VTDAVAANRTPRGDKRGQQVVKFSPDGKVLMRLGAPGVEGGGTDHFTSPSDVVVAPNGDLFIADGHTENGNNRVVKFSKDGKYIKEWGKTGYAPGEFRTLHAIAMDSRGRIFVGDRANNRIQIFDQEGKFLTQWTQFGRPSGIFFDTRDQIYVADSESDDVQNPGWEMGIRIGDARTGWISAFIQYPWGDPRETPGTGAEFVAVDRDGNLYGGEPRPKLAGWRVDGRVEVHRLGPLRVGEGMGLQLEREPRGLRGAADEQCDGKDRHESTGNGDGHMTPFVRCARDRRRQAPLRDLSLYQPP